MITTLASVKIQADLYTRAEEGAPETTDAGVLGDVWLDNDADSATYGKTYELTVITPAAGATPASYTWSLLTRDDARIIRTIPRAEKDYLAIRGIPFELDDDEITIIYPESSDYDAAEMVCYLCELGSYQGRGEKSESVGDRSVTHDDKVYGYPRSIVGTIEQYSRPK